MTSRRPARALAAATALVLALALGACGGSDEAGEEPDAPATTSTSETGVPTSEPSTTSILPPPTSPAAEPTEPTEPPTSAAPEPGAGGTVGAVAASEDWVAALDELVDPSVPAKRRAAHIKGGADLVVAIPDLDQAIAGIPLTFTVTAPTVDGNTGAGQVNLTSGGEDFGSVRDVTFARVDGVWRLTREGVCQMASVAGLTCP